MPADAQPREGLDYYIDRQGRWVWLASYHLKRGSCCGSKCRNCPFDWVNVDRALVDPHEPRPPMDRPNPSEAPGSRPGSDSSSRDH
jgi:hypothetical protein